MARKQAALPSRAGELARRHPKIWAAYAELGNRCSEAGPLDPKSRRLVKIALAAGAGSEGAVHSHVRRGMAEGLSPDEIRHIALLGITTLGLPAAVRALSWIEDIVPTEKRARKK